MKLLELPDNNISDIFQLLIRDCKSITDIYQKLNQLRFTCKKFNYILSNDKNIKLSIQVLCDILYINKLDIENLQISKVSHNDISHDITITNKYNQIMYYEPYLKYYCIFEHGVYECFNVSYQYSNSIEYFSFNDMSRHVLRDIGIVRIDSIIKFTNYNKYFIIATTTVAYCYEKDDLIWQFPKFDDPYQYDLNNLDPYTGKLIPSEIIKKYHLKLI